MTHQMAVSGGRLTGYFVRTPDIRNFYAEGWASAAKCKSFRQWIEQVFIRIINRVMGREVYKEIPIDD